MTIASRTVAVVMTSLRSLARLVVLLSARRVPAPAGELLVVAPHPDDETLGCGGRIAQYRAAGHRVSVLVIGDGSGSHRLAPSAAEVLVRIRHEELAAALDLLGVEESDIVTWSLQDDTLSEHEAALVDRIAALVMDRRPTLILVTDERESHTDHATAARATRKAIERVMLDDDPRIPQLQYYPIWLWNDWPFGRRFGIRAGFLQLVATVRSPRTQRFPLKEGRAIKSSALRQHASQLGFTAAELQELGIESVALPRAVVRRALRGPELYFDAHL